MCKHQAINGMHASVENPKGSLLWKLPEWVEAFGSPGKIVPEHPIWNWVTSDGCQFHVVYPGDDDYGAPMEKSQLWMSSFSLNALGLRCRKPNALKPCAHTHTHIRGRATVNGVKDVSIATFSGVYTAELATVYAKELAHACKTTTRPLKTRMSGLMELASSSPVASGTAPVAGIRNERSGVLDCLYGQDNTRVFELRAGGMCMDLDHPHGESVHFSKLQGCKNTALRHYQGLAPAPMAVTGPP